MNATATQHTTKQHEQGVSQSSPTCSYVCDVQNDMKMALVAVVGVVVAVVIVAAAAVVAVVAVVVAAFWGRLQAPQLRLLAGP